MRTTIAIDDVLMRQAMQGFRQERDVATARQLFSSMVPLPTI